jgi:transcription antitermination factor NusA-like protein/ribosomal protein S9
MEVPEIADKLVEIVGVAREPGYRSKIAVISHADGVDPVGACVGPRGSRVRMVVSELRGEKIDIIPHNDEPARFVAKALSPARVREVIVDDEERQATVIVPDDQLSLAIGRDGQNARLAARLTGWRVDIKSETEFSQEDQDVEYEGEETFDGRCMAVLTTGRRCPNAAIEGSTYCGLPQHQALSRFETSQMAILGTVSETEVEILADPDADQGQVDEIVAKAEAEFVEEAPEEEVPAESTAGPVVEEDPSSSQAAGDVPPSTPPAEETAEEPTAEADGQDAPAEEPEAEESEAAVEAPAEPEAAEEDSAEAEAVEEAPEESPAEKPKAVEKKVDVIPGADLEPIAVEADERPRSAEEQARLEAEEEERARREAELAGDSEEEPSVGSRAPAKMESGARFLATGKRKSSIARVTLTPGNGKFVVNKRELAEFFPRPLHQTMARQALVAAGYEGNVDVSVRVHGGGISGQAGAVRHGIARALTEIDPELRGDLKRRGFLTRDARVKERRKAGLKKARKKPQFSKR